jgi:PAS domain S-box-containing protein
MIHRVSERVMWAGAVAIALIGIAGAITYTRVQVLIEAAGWVSHSERVRYTLQHTLSTVLESESAVRGYYITHDEPFLEPYKVGRAEFDAALRSLTALVADNATQLERVQELDRAGHQLLDRFDFAVNGIRDGTYELPKPPVASTGLKKLVDPIRTQIALMQADEESQLAIRLKRAADARFTALVSIGSLSGAAAALVVLLVLVSRRAAQDIRSSERWLATTLSSIGDGVIATDPLGAVSFVNPIAAELTGWSQAAARGRQLEDVFRIVDAATHAPAENPVAQVLRKGGVAGLPSNTLLIRRDGAEFPIEDSGAPIRDDHGKVNGVVVVFKDATAVRAAQLALQASEERLRMALEGAELGAVDHDLRTGKAVWNDRLYAIVGYPLGTPVDTDMINLHTAVEDWNAVLASLQHSKVARVPFRSVHRIVRANDQAVRWVSSNGTFIYDKEGRAVRFIGVVQDVTENRRLEAQVRQSQKLDALGTLAGGIAHDFNNILAVLRGNLSVFRSEIQADNPLMSCVADMENACSRATALVRQILTFGSRQDHNRQVSQLQDVVAEGMRLLRATLPAEIEIRTQYAPDLPAVLVDANQIHQIIANLGINAAQAIGRQGGTIEVQLDSFQIDSQTAAASTDLKAGRYVRLRFSDNGSGIPREIIDRIFEPFFTTKAASGGTGLGLSVVRGILKSHDAHATVYSEPGRGTHVNLYFPAVDEKTQMVPPVKSTPMQGHGERILFLDDEESLVILARRLFERMGYRIAGFSDPAKAVAAFAAAPEDFDLVLTDLSMPGMNGMDVARRILEIRPDIPILLATGYVRSEDVDQARAIGIREVIWKPQTIGEMGDVLAQQLRKLIPEHS